MKTAQLLLALLLFSTYTSKAQEKDKQLFKEAKAIGGFSFNFSSNGRYSFIGEGAASFKNFYFGGYGYSSDLGNHSSSTNNYNYTINSDEGGLMLGAVSNTDQFFFLFTEVKFGWGNISATRQISQNIYEEFGQKTQSIIPKLGVGLTPISLIQLRLYASYHYSGTIELDGIDSSILNDYNFGIGLYFGSF